jgi:hypothetical protein
MEREMTVHDALEVVREEHRHVTAKLDALDAFQEGVETLSPSPSGRQTAGGITVSGEGTQTLARTASGDDCRQVRELFEETIGEYVEDCSGLVAIREEFGETVAAALAPGTGRQFTPKLERAVRCAARSRRTELQVLEQALDTERESLQRVADALGEITDWLRRADDQSLLTLGYEALQRRHEQLETHRDRIDQLVEDRQVVLHRTTSHEGATGLTHLTVVSYLYEEFPTVVPALSALARLARRCADCQRTLRDHLTRRV